MFVFFSIIIGHDFTQTGIAMLANSSRAHRRFDSKPYKNNNILVTKINYFCCGLLFFVFCFFGERRSAFFIISAKGCKIQPLKKLLFNKLL